MTSFDEWWPTMGQTIGKTVAEFAWDHQQERIEKLESELKEMQRDLDVANELLDHYRMGNH